MTEHDPLAVALRLPNGARFYRCALQLNPFAYVQRHGKASRFATEEAYNQAMIEACKANDIEVIAVTDHYRVRSAEGLCQAARFEEILEGGRAAFETRRLKYDF